MDGLLLLNVPCSQEFSGVLRFWAYVSCLWVSVLFFQLYITDNKTSRLMVKRFSTMRDTQRSSQELHEEEEMEEGDRDEQEEKKGDSSGERQIHTVICSQCSL